MLLSVIGWLLLPPGLTCVWVSASQRRLGQYRTSAAYVGLASGFLLLAWLAISF